MAMYLVCLPSGPTRSLWVDYEALCESAGSREALSFHSCAQGDPCRGSVPCLSSGIFSSLIERHFGIDRESARLSVRGGVQTKAAVDPYATTDAPGITVPVASSHDEADCCAEDMRDGCDAQLGRDASHQLIKDDVVISVSCRLLGGKGGFGALLKAKGHRKKQSSNVDSCRTLTGERVRHTRLNELAQRQRESTVDPGAARLPLPKDAPEPAEDASTQETHLKHVKKLRKESKRVKSTVVKGLTNSASIEGQTQTDSERQQLVERALDQCMDVYDLA
ncbi:SDE2 homolog, putative [Babesia ovata]|uniref:SDE2 homolog, putative n=1 Tax=Babesia ovata TaxID=189622 RepID=A0A2H6KHD4_9APIC|nr:SDE2 homolog, putative [Babesia ovata]GBE62402.1 SDE2 homolog, putative [Babesia ovata]